jgi:lysozyme
MKISENGLALVMAFEGCLKAVPGKPGFFKPYVCPAGVLTIGWGHTNHHEPKFTSSTVWSQAKCDEVLRGDMAGFERHVLKLAKVSMEQHEFDALVSWAYNTGGPASASLWRSLNAGRKGEIPAKLAQWNKGGGKVLAGLVRRRKAEGMLFEGKIAEALKVAGTKARPVIVRPEDAPPPPDVEPVDPKPSGWLSSILKLFEKG